MIQKADSQLIKRINEIQILRLIRKLGPVSRIELAKRTKMSKVAVFEIVNRLVDQRYVIDVGKGKSTNRGGKRPSLVKLNASHHFVIGIELRRTETLIAIADLEANIFKIKTFNFDVTTDPCAVIRKMFARIDVLVQGENASTEQLISIGIGIPGVVDYEKGTLRFADTLPGWDKIQIRKMFTEKYNVPVIIENDVNTIALGESILGAGRDVRDMLCLWIGSGIGAGLIMDKKLISGYAGGTGEIGYLEVGRHLSKEREFKYFRKQYKYFGDLLSETNLFEIISREIKIKSGQNPEQKSLSAVLKARAHKTLIEPILDEYAYFVGVLCLDMIKIIDPGLIILSGTVVENSDFLVSRVRNYITENTSRIPLKTGEITVGKLKEEAGLSGAIALALQIVFD
jgi:predicted NBD/HSP70 family sugar kinase